MKFKNVKGDVLEFSEEEIENLKHDIDFMCNGPFLMKAPTDKDYYLVDEDD